MPKLLAACLAPLLLAGAAPDRPVPRLNPAAPTSAYLNGLWYEPTAEGGVRFVPGDRYSVGGVFTARRPEAIDFTLDLKGGYAVPPFGEAHNHSIDGPWTAPTAEKYLRQGVFYYKNPNNVAGIAELGRGLFNKPGALDVVFANGGLSVAGGHPNLLYGSLAAQYQLDPDKLDGQAFFDVPTAAAVGKRWQEILKGKPDFIKLYLLDAAGQAGGKNRGLSAEPLRRAVELAHGSGLRTTVHVETAADLALALEAGAGEAAHLPGHVWAPGLGAEAYTIGDDLARRLAARGFVVVTTTLVAEGITPEGVPEAKRPERLREVQAAQAANLRRLHKAGVRLAVGVDTYDKTALDEAKYLRKLGAFTDAELLRIWVETGPASVFPGRAIGRLAPGFEASFLVLEGDPSRDFAQVERIRTRVKQGAVLGGATGPRGRAATRR